MFTTSIEITKKRLSHSNFKYIFIYFSKGVAVRALGQKKTLHSHCAAETNLTAALISFKLILKVQV